MATTHEQARQDTARAADSLRQVAAEKHAAARLDPQRDTFAETADRAKRERWAATASPTHRPRP
jgi:hypothetical protein